MKKTVSIKPKGKTQEQAVDNWVSARTTLTESDSEKMKRLTIDVPENLHKRIKTYCAANGLIMADEIRGMLEKKFPTEAA